MEPELTDGRMLQPKHRVWFVWDFVSFKLLYSKTIKITTKTVLPVNNMKIQKECFQKQACKPDSIGAFHCNMNCNFSCSRFCTLMCRRIKQQLTVSRACSVFSTFRLFSFRVTRVLRTDCRGCMDRSNWWYMLLQNLANAG